MDVLEKLANVYTQLQAVAPGPFLGALAKEYKGNICLKNFKKILGELN